MELERLAQNPTVLDDRQASLIVWIRLNASEYSTLLEIAARKKDEQAHFTFAADVVARWEKNGP